jgi:hypothetical protein
MVDFPGSMWAIMAKFLIWDRGLVMMLGRNRRCNGGQKSGIGNNMKFKQKVFSPLTSHFKARAMIGALTLGMVVAPATGLGKEYKPAKTGDQKTLTLKDLVGSEPVCVSLASVSNPQSPLEFYLAKQYEGQSRTRSGAMVLDPKAEKPLQVCFDRALDKEDQCHFFKFGTSENENISLNPAARVTDAVRELTLVHEARHSFQRTIGIGYSNTDNMPEAERVIIYWVMEADARMASVLYAYEKMLYGEPAYRQALVDDIGDGIMMRAFEESVRHNGDIAGAVRAGMLTFLKQPQIPLHYANITAEWINDHHKAFDPEKPVNSLYESAAMTKLGETGFGNYDPHAVVMAFAKSFTDKDYKHLIKSRVARGGPVCG